MALTDGIIGCWSPSIRGSGYLLPDLSGRGNHGTLTNMDAGTDWPGASVRGVSGRVLDYDGTDDRVLLSRTSDIIGLTACSVVAWGSIRTYGGDGRALFSLPISNTADTSPFQVLDLSVSSTGQVRGNVGNGLTRVIYTATDLVTTANKWFCIAVLWDGATITTALDGVVSSSSAAAVYTGIGVSAASVGTARIGSYRNESQYTADGQIGEVSLFNRRLTQPEVLELFRRGNGAIGRELTGQAKRRVYGFVPAGFKAYLARRQNQIIGGGVR